MYIGSLNVNPRPCRMTGYRQPPIHTRFRKGRSGNPGGRPRRARDLLTVIERALDRPAPETVGGGRRVSRREAIVARLVEQAAAGELRATKLLLDLAEKARRAAGPDPIDEDGEDPREFLRRELDRLAAAAATPEPDAE